MSSRYAVLRRTVLRWAFVLAGLSGVLSSTAAVAEDKFPTRPIRIVTAFAPGSVTDVVARLLAEQLRQTFHQSVVVENKPGALGIVAVEEMARARPDGHTLMVGNISTNGITPLVEKDKFSIDYARDVTVVARTFAEFAAYARAHPGQIRYGSTGVGHFGHYQSEMLANLIGAKFVHIPNKQGSPGMLKDMLAGDVHFSFINASTALAPIRAGYLHPLAVVAEQRVPGQDSVPTMGDLGHADFGLPLWAALFAPAATPRDVLETLHAAVNKALEGELRDPFAKQLIAPAPTPSLEAARAWARDETARLARVIRDVKVDAD
jgi:tripartite-type tricarboxylate transporter receptor subunit TctC